VQLIAEDDQDPRSLTIPVLIAKVNDHHMQAAISMCQVVSNAKLAGDMLVILKNRVRNAGQKWMPWVEANLEVSYESVVRYMRISKRWAKLADAVQNQTAMTLDEAINLIVDKKRPLKRPKPRPVAFARQTLRKNFGKLIMNLAAEELDWLSEPISRSKTRLDQILKQAVQEHIKHKG
jgi:hypothetical protein